jgi:purine-binding chemotaxis protein CheW
MTDQSFVIFSLRGLILAVDAKVVREIIWLPELTLIEECPFYIAGVVNMRGRILPVMDLNVRFGHAPQRYSCLDRVIILDVSEFISETSSQQSLLPSLNSHFDLMGIIVNEVLDLIDIPEDNIEPAPFEGSGLNPHPQFVRGEATAGEDIIMILNNRAILEPELHINEAELENTVSTVQSAIGYFCPEADPKEWEIFHNRAINLQHLFGSEDSAKSMAVAVIRLNNEYLCVELESVLQFSNLHNLTPMPCCPEHIAGNMNLRGNVLTVLDIRGLLNMQAGKINESTKVIVADSGEFPVGVVIDEILDVIYLKAVDIVPVPSSIRIINDKFVKGAAPYGSRMMAILDFKAILSWDGLTVNEEV